MEISEKNGLQRRSQDSNDNVTAGYRNTYYYPPLLGYCLLRFSTATIRYFPHLFRGACIGFQPFTDSC